MHVEALVGPLVVILSAGLAGQVSAINGGDVVALKVWLDRFVFNGTLRIVKDGDDRGSFRTCEQKAREQGISFWPPAEAPALCMLGVGPSSVYLLAALVDKFPDLQLHVFHFSTHGRDGWDDPRRVVDELLRPIPAARRALIHEHFTMQKFAGSCSAISWSADTPQFSFRRFAPLLHSTEYALALLNLNGCTPETLTEDVDPYYCEYLHSSFRQTVCGQVNVDKSSEFQGAEWLFPLVDVECSGVLCMCHTRADDFVDVVDMGAVTCPEHGAESAFAGQWGQDFFVFHNVYSDDPRQGRGVYVDIGASHPYHLSNTAFFDECLGWRGLCVEPNPRLRPILGAFRSCEVITKCAWANASQQKFGQLGELAAMTKDTTVGHSEPFHVQAGNAEGLSFEADCEPLQNLLGASPLMASLRAESLRPRVDLVSIDVESAEIEVLKDFPFDAWDVRVIVVEASRHSAMALDSILLPRGFLQVAILGRDAVYVSRQAAKSLPDNPVLPTTLKWNDPLTNEATIVYERFQRFFGVDGALDAEVGDPRVHNETEVVRQAAQIEAWRAEVQTIHPGEEYLSKLKAALRNPEVAAILREPVVKSALELLADDELKWWALLGRDPSIRRKMEKLMKEGVIGPAGDV